MPQADQSQPPPDQQQRNDRANAESAASIAAQEKPAPQPVAANLAALPAEMFSADYLDQLERIVDGVDERSSTAAGLDPPGRSAVHDARRAVALPPNFPAAAE